MQQGLPLKRQAVIDLGSNSFRLVIFDYQPAGWWKLTDEIYRSVRIGEGMNGKELKRKPIKRALAALEVFAHYCKAIGLDPKNIYPVATSAIREATNQSEFLTQAEQLTGLKIRVLSREEEAYYGYLAAVNSSRIKNGLVLDLGGGSMQLISVTERKAKQLGSWQLGAVYLTERFLNEETAQPEQIQQLRNHVFEQLKQTDWLSHGTDLVGIGGTVRNLASATQACLQLPPLPIQGTQLKQKTLKQLIERLVATPSSQRGQLSGIKPERGDIILAGALVIDCVMEASGKDSLEVMRTGLREGVFFSTHLSEYQPPLFKDVAASSIEHLMQQYQVDRPHAKQVRRHCLSLFDQLADMGLISTQSRARELLKAAALLHEIGISIDHHNHHKHSRYLVLNAGLPGFHPREIAVIAQVVRYYRKGSPSAGWLAPHLLADDEQLIIKLSAILKLASQLERTRDQTIERTDLSVKGQELQLKLVSDEDQTVQRWAVERCRSLFEKAFGLRLTVAD